MAHQQITDLIKFGSDARGEVFQGIMLNIAHMLYGPVFHCAILFGTFRAQQHLTPFNWMKTAT